MDHREVIETYAVERYLLGEMSEPERESFEEHYFDCSSCFRDVQTAEIFRANLRAHLADQAGRKRWSLGPLGAVAATLLLCLLSLGAYQNLVVIPDLRARVETPRPVQPLLFWNDTRGEEPSLNASAAGPDLLLTIGKLPEWEFAKYRVECLGASGVKWVAELPDSARGEDLLLTVPAGLLSAGRYRLVLYGVDSGGAEQLQTKELKVDNKR